MVFKKYGAFMMFILSLFSFAQAKKGREAEYPVEKFFIKRQSKYLLHRTLTDHEMKAKLMSLFEASRWAFSSYNNQPWSFVYITPSSSTWLDCLNLLVLYNRKWAQNAGALLLVTSRKNYEYNGKPSATNLFDTGVAVGNLTTQAVILDLVVHAIEGFDYSGARKLFNVPDSHAIIAILAIGQAAPKGACIEGMTRRELQDFRKKDAQPTGRKIIKEFAFEDAFKK